LGFIHTNSFMYTLLNAHINIVIVKL